MANRQHDDADQALKNGLVSVHRLRDSIARFLDGHSRTVDEFIACCDRNGWDASAAFDFREAMCKLGCVLSSLVLWDNEVLPDAHSDAGKLLEEVRNMEADYARKSKS